MQRLVYSEGPVYLRGQFQEGATLVLSLDFSFNSLSQWDHLRSGFQVRFPLWMCVIFNIWIGSEKSVGRHLQFRKQQDIGKKTNDQQHLSLFH